MNNIILCIIFALICYCFLLTSINSSCLNESQFVTYGSNEPVRGTKFSGTSFSKNSGIPEINMKLDTDVQCGYYSFDSQFGPGIMIVGKHSNNINGSAGFVSFANYSAELDSTSRFEFLNLTRIINKSNKLISTFNRGCCI